MKGEGRVDSSTTALAPRKQTRKERRAARKAERLALAEVQKQVLAAHPGVVKTLRDAGMTDAKIFDWILKLAPIGIGDAELVKIGEADARRPYAANAAQSDSRAAVERTNDKTKTRPQATSSPARSRSASSGVFELSTAFEGWEARVRRNLLDTVGRPDLDEE